MNVGEKKTCVTLRTLPKEGKMLTEEMVIGMDEMCVTLLDFLNA